ncbi:protein of unknown function [Cupriavidus taiwanensis]|uniref:Transposase n=1 Tax=Cupriavidus taiwanensis TaxID=164546 RepID=A0A7Z7J443_9BURK|nr:protein of unknown function [Cupriavidus taiwanensis]SOY99754.1 hypothetical protein CBM2595_A10097 [Cupriavidus taiwanensis]SOZ02796.1 hypothetical protein CBM2597_A10125 [Cupriavidus taiwanensis]SPC06163.1 hypothetical protein CBM2594_A10125 [Cupriavidus taiwanensis]SPD38196.1 protein of unknown function [Cupriavidus taiwanensis]
MRNRWGLRGKAVFRQEHDAGGLELRLPIQAHSQLRKIIKTRGHFPSDEAATKLLWLALRNITGKWGSSTHDWQAAMNQFAILYEERFIHPHR